MSVSKVIQLMYPYKVLSMLSSIYIIIAAVLWSLNPAVIQRFGRRLKPATITVFRALAALALLIPIAIISCSRSGINLYALLVAVVSGVIGPGIGDAAYAKSIQLVGGSLAAIIGFTYIFIAQALAVVLLGEGIELAVVVGSILAFLGIVIALYNKNPHSSKAYSSGVLYAVITAISWGAASALIKLATTSIDPLTLAIIRLSTVLITLGPFAALLEKPRLRKELKNLVIISITTGTLSWGIGLYLLHYSIAVIGVSKTVLGVALTPILSQAIVKLIAREEVGLRSVVGAMLVTIGIILSSL